MNYLNSITLDYKNYLMISLIPDQIYLFIINSTILFLFIINSNFILGLYLIN